MVPCSFKITVVYFPHKLVKGQVLADFLDNYASLDIKTEQGAELSIYEAKKQPWTFKFDGSRIENSARAKVVIIFLRKIKSTMSCNIAFKGTNKQVECEALVINLKILLELRAKEV